MEESQPAGPSSPQPSSGRPSSHPAPRSYHLPVLLLAFVVSVIVVVVWLMLPQWRQKSADLDARTQAAEAVSMINKGDVQAGYAHLMRALQKSPKEPDILRQVAGFLDKLPASLDQAVNLRRVLIQTETATWEDRIALADGLLRQDNIDEAAEILASLPPEISRGIRAEELRATLLARTGRADEARALLLTTWAARPDDARCRIKLAGLNVQSPFPEISTAALQKLWTAARKTDDLSPLAMVALRDSRNITPATSEEMLALIERAPGLSDIDAQSLLDSCVSQSPSLVSRAISIARSRLKEALPGSRDFFYQWLAKYNQPDIILKEVSEAEALQSRQLMLAYCDALLRKGSLDQLDLLLKNVRQPLSKVDLALMQAYLSKARGESDEAVATLLRVAEMRAGLAHDLKGLQQVAAGAESFRLLDIAISAGRRIAENRSHRLPALKHVYELQKKIRDIRGMLVTAEAVLAERPGLPPYADEAAYLHLISGLDMEMSLAAAATDASSALGTLNRALAASYTGNLPVLESQLSQLTPDSLTPGPRAVLAGLLMMVGRSEEAASLAALADQRTLLPEEHWFLSKALK